MWEGDPGVGKCGSGRLLLAPFHTIFHANTQLQSGCNLAVPILVAPPAEPGHLKRRGVVLMVRHRPFPPAALAGAPN